MEFIDDVILSANYIWEKCAEEDFFVEMGNNTLSEERFKNYLIQDSLYLKEYLKAHEIAILKSETLDQVRAFSSILSYVNECENQTRLKYLQDFNLSVADIEKYTQQSAGEKYANYLIQMAMKEEIPEILMAFLPCMLGYYKLFINLKEKYPNLLNSYYQTLIEDYTSIEYQKSCEFWIKFTKTNCNGLTIERKKSLKKIYLKSSMYELELCHML